MENEKIVCALDVGAKEIRALICRVNATDGEVVIGIGKAPSAGFKKGVVVNLDQAIRAIQQTISAAEQKSGVQISSVILGISGNHIKSVNSRGIIAVTRHDNLITDYDVERVIDASKAIAIPADRQIIHILPQRFIIDDDQETMNPVGLVSARLEAEVHIVTGSVTAILNLCKTVTRAGYKIDDLVFQPLAEAMAVLNQDDQESGTILIDLGSEVTSIAAYHESGVLHTAAVDIAGNNITRDLAIGLRTPLDDADLIKTAYGCALECLANAKDMVTVKTIGNRPDREVPRTVIASIIEARAKEILKLVQRELGCTNFHLVFKRGIVLTGGGALLPGIEQLAGQIFGLPVSIGVPKNFCSTGENLANPKFAAACGLLRWGIKPPMDKKSRRSF